MNEELFNKPWARKEDQIEYDPDETVESFARKMQVERKKKLEETYKPTEKEQEVINLLSIPIKNKIKELNYEKGINNLIAKLTQIRMPQNMSKEDIEDLLFRASVRMNSLKEDVHLKSMYKIKFLEKEIDFLLEQLSKRLK